MISKILITLLGYFLVEGVSTNLPLVRWHPEEGVQEGGTVRLECQVSPKVSGPAIWLKLDPLDPNNHELLSHGQLLIRQDERLSVTFDTGSNTYSLLIRGVSYSDEGGYQCQVPIKPDEEEVQAAPPVVINLISRKMNQSAGERIHPKYFNSIWINLILLILIF